MNISKSFTSNKKINSVATVLIGLVAGIATLIVMKSGRADVLVDDQAVFSTPVIAKRLSPVVMRPALVGFGTLTPMVDLTISSEVTGNVIWIHPDLKSGKVLARDTVVIRLDDEDLRLSLKQTSAELAVKNAQLRQKKLEFSNTKNYLVSATERLNLTKGELQRQTELVSQGLFSNSNLDKQRQQVLNQETEVSNINLSLAIMPSSIEILEAEISSSQARLSQRKRDLNRSEISLNQTGRIGRVLVSKGSFVMPGSKLFDISSADQFEVSVQVPANQYQNIFSSQNPESLQAVIQVNHNGVIQQVSGVVQGFDDGVDAATRMLGVVVSVSDDTASLVKGSYAEVVLHAQDENRWVVPRSAIHQGNLYWIDENNQLQITASGVDFMQGDFAVLVDKPELTQLITSALFPAIEGMTVEPYEDESFDVRLSSYLSTQ